jgi:class 3 adenylate cyclase
VGQFDYTQIIEEVNKLLDEQLFQHALINDIRSLMEYASDYSLSMKKCSQFIQRIVSHDMCGIFLNGNDFILSLNSPVTLADESNFIKHCCKRLGVDTEEIRAEKITQQEFISCAIEPRFVISEKKDLHSVHAGLSFSYDRPVKSLDIYLYSKDRDIDNAVHRRFLKMLLPELHLVMENAFLYRKNLELQKLLKSYVSGSAWNNALSQTEPESDKTDHKVIYESVMFADLCGFTTLVETMSPEETIEFLNHVFSVLTEIVLEFDGDVDKYMGDCIMVRFSNPSNAIKAAFRMQIQLTELSQELKLPKLLMRIGIHSGKVIQGSIGSRIRRELTIVGDTVNVASRMETSCPVGSILITEETYSQVKDLCRLVHSDIILVKGKRKPLKVYEVASPVETTAKEKNEAG